ICALSLTRSLHVLYTVASPKIGKEKVSGTFFHSSKRFLTPLRKKTCREKENAGNLFPPTKRFLTPLSFLFFSFSSLLFFSASARHHCALSRYRFVVPGDLGP